MEPVSLFVDVAAIIFDLDGTLVLIDRIEHEAYRRALSHWGKTLSLEAYRKLARKSPRATNRAIIARLGLDIKWTELAAAQDREQQSIAAQGKIPVIGPALRFLKAIPRDKYHVGLVSTFPMERIDWAVRRAGLARYVEAILSADQLPGKPEPDLYVAAIDLAATTPWNTVIVESSAAGVGAAVRAGARVVAVPNEATRGEDFSAAHVCVDSLDQLIPFL